MSDHWHSAEQPQKSSLWGPVAAAQGCKPGGSYVLGQPSHWLSRPPHTGCLTSLYFSHPNWKAEPLWKSENPSSWTSQRDTEIRNYSFSRNTHKPHPDCTFLSLVTEVWSGCTRKINMQTQQCVCFKPNVMRGKILKYAKEDLFIFPDTRGFPSSSLPKPSSLSPLNLISKTSCKFSKMSPLGWKVWQGQCMLISRPRLDSAKKERTLKNHIPQVEQLQWISTEGACCAVAHRPGISLTVKVPRFGKQELT